MLGSFYMLFCCLDFFYLFKKNIFDTNGLDPDQGHLGLIWIYTVFKGYQQGKRATVEMLSDMCPVTDRSIDASC